MYSLKSGHLADKRCLDVISKPQGAPGGGRDRDLRAGKPECDLTQKRTQNVPVQLRYSPSEIPTASPQSVPRHRTRSWMKSADLSHSSTGFMDKGTASDEGDEGLSKVTALSGEVYPRGPPLTHLSGESFHVPAANLSTRWRRSDSEANSWRNERPTGRQPASR